MRAARARAETIPVVRERANVLSPSPDRFDRLKSSNTRRNFTVRRALRSMHEPPRFVRAQVIQQTMSPARRRAPALTTHATNRRCPHSSIGAKVTQRRAARAYQRQVRAPIHPRSINSSPRCTHAAIAIARFAPIHRGRRAEHPCLEGGALMAPSASPSPSIPNSSSPNSQTGVTAALPREQ